MPLVDSYPPGTFCWVDLAASDADKAKAFYTELFGWEATDVPVGPGGVYTMLSQGGKTVGAVFQMSPEMRNEGLASYWQSYVAVENADSAAEKVEGLGGKLVSPPYDVMEAGRMAMVEDPTGARFVLWQAKGTLGAELVNEPNSLCWNELQTGDINKALKFYDDLFGWKAKFGKGAMVDTYVELQNGPRAAGGMLEIQDDWGDDYSSNWAVYFAVADLDATIAKAKELGGKAEMDPIVLEHVGRFTSLTDTGGASFSVIQLAEGAAE